MIRPLIAPFAVREGAGSLTVALILAAQAVPAAALALPVGRLADRWGYRRLAAAGALLTCGGGALLAVPGGPPVLILAQAVVGVGGVAVWLAVQGWMIARDRGESLAARDRRLANYSLVVLGGQLAGPVAGGAVAEAIGTRGAFACFAVLGALDVLCALLVADPQRADGTPPGRTPPGSLWSSYQAAAGMLRAPGMALTLVVSFCAAGLLDLRTSFQPLYFQALGLSPLVIGVVLSASTAAGAVSRPVLLVLLRRLRIGTVAVLALVPGAVAVGLVPQVTGLPVIFLLAVVTGLALGLAQPLTLRLTADITDPAQHGVAIGLRLLANRTARWLNPVLFGGLLAVAGLGGAFLLAAAVVGAAALWAGRGLNRSPAERRGAADG